MRFKIGDAVYALYQDNDGYQRPEMGEVVDIKQDTWFPYVVLMEADLEEHLYSDAELGPVRFIPDIGPVTFIPEACYA